MSKNKSKKLTKVSGRNAPTIINVDYLGEAGHDGQTSFGVSVIRHIQIDTESALSEINAWEARRLAGMLVEAADRMERL